MFHAVTFHAATFHAADQGTAGCRRRTTTSRLTPPGKPTPPHHGDRFWLIATTTLNVQFGSPEGNLP
jgi:ectoine hydroxylase-related dioxygenase (phytanoyl-CoA dioxygenase family)